jgi:hypothetical protein
MVEEWIRLTDYSLPIPSLKAGFWQWKKGCRVTNCNKISENIKLWLWQSLSA